jgi:hypothetical protein
VGYYACGTGTRASARTGATGASVGSDAIRVVDTSVFEMSVHIAGLFTLKSLSAITFCYSVTIVMPVVKGLTIHAHRVYFPEHHALFRVFCGLGPLKMCLDYRNNFTC